MNSPKVLDSDSLLQDMNSLQIRKNTLSSVSEPNLPKVQRICHLPRDTTERICHLCMEEFGTLEDLQNHIPTNHNLNHPTKYYSNSYSVSNSPSGYYKSDTTQERNSVSESLLISSEYICIECNRSGQGLR